MLVFHAKIERTKTSEIWSYLFKWSDKKFRFSRKVFSPNYDKKTIKEKPLKIVQNFSNSWLVFKRLERQCI